MKKSTVLNTLNDLPKEFPLDDLQEKLLVIEKIEEGLEDVKAGRTISHTRIKKQVRNWLK